MGPMTPKENETIIYTMMKYRETVYYKTVLVIKLEPHAFITAINCSQPNATPNGRYYLTSNNENEMEMQVTFKTTFNFNTTLRFKCNVGFTLPDMYDSYRLCQDNETWSGLEPTCSGKYMGHAMGLRGVFCQQRATTTCAITLQKHSHTNILKISPPKTESFQIKLLMCFIFLLKT